MISFFVQVYKEMHNPHYYYLKRVLDILISLLMLLGLFPLLLIIAALIKLDSCGPVLFRQVRVGAQRRVKNGRVCWEPAEFTIYKFRTMVNNADESLHREQVRAFVDGKLLRTERGWVEAKIRNDPRVTRCGHFLRKFSLDEIPQIINILRGEMSIVGPRPVPPYEAALHKDHHRERLTVLPGMTGLWQITGRGHADFEEMIALDIEYAQSCSLQLDLKIMFLTIPAALSGLGAS